MKLADHDSLARGAAATAGRHGVSSRAKHHFPSTIDGADKGASRKAEISASPKAPSDAGALDENGGALAPQAADFSLALTYVAVKGEAPGKTMRHSAESLAPAMPVRSAFVGADGVAINEQAAETGLNNGSQTLARDVTSVRSLAIHHARSAKAADLPSGIVGDIHSERHFDAAKPPVFDGEIPARPTVTQNFGSPLVAPSGAASVAAPHAWTTGAGGDETTHAPATPSTIRSGTADGERFAGPSPTHVLRLSISPEGVGAATLALRLRGDALDLHLRVAEPSALQVAESSRDDLSERLRANGYAVERLHFDLAPQTAPNATDSSSSGGEAARREPNSHEQTRKPGFVEDAQDGKTPVERRNGVYL